MSLNTVVENVTRKVDNPQGGDKIERVAELSFPRFGSYDEKGDLVAGSVTLDELVSGVGGLEKVVDYVNGSLYAKARQIAYNELGKGDETSKAIRKIVDNFKAIMTDSPEDSIVAMVQSMPQVQALLAGVSVEKNIKVAVDMNRINTDARAKSATGGE